MTRDANLDSDRRLGEAINAHDLDAIERGFAAFPDLRVARRADRALPRWPDRRALGSSDEVGMLEQLTATASP